MKSLPTLIELKQKELDEKRRVLRQLQEEQERILQEKHALKKALQKEANLAANQPDLARYFGEYAHGNEQQQSQLQAKIDTVEQLIETQQDHIREAFSELKQLEIVKEQRDAEAKKEANRKETQELDEIGLRGYGQKDGE